MPVTYPSALSSYPGPYPGGGVTGLGRLPGFKFIDDGTVFGTGGIFRARPAGTPRPKKRGHKKRA